MTLQELYEKSKADRKEYEARLEAAEAEYQIVKHAIEQAKEAAERALAANDTAAHTEAKHKEDYNRERAFYLFSVPTTPYYQEDEYKSLIAQIQKAALSGREPLWSELNDVLIRGREIIRQINAIADVESYAMRNIHATVPRRTDECEYPRYFLRRGVEDALNNMFKRNGEIERILRNHLRKEA